MAGAVLTAREREEIRVGIEADESLSDIAVNRPGNPGGSIP
jgi:hypothetical protein